LQLFNLQGPRSSENLDFGERSSDTLHRKEAIMAQDITAVRRVLKHAEQTLHSRPNVVATGIGYKLAQDVRTDELSIVCSVTRKLPSSGLSTAELVPATIEGVATDVVQTGRLHAFQSRTGRHRPAPGGVSIGHRDITAGTFGCLVKRAGETFILSNNHVLANSNDAEPGDPILQPGPADGGQTATDSIAVLEYFVPIRFTAPELPSECPTARTVIAALNAICLGIGSETRYRIVSLQTEDNFVDAAIARPMSPADVSDEILEIGVIRSAAEAQLGTAVRKSGRTTGLTSGEILQTDVTADVSYGGGRVARFADQLLAGPMSQGGDSGSAVLDEDDRLIGLLFAGSDTTTVINRIGHVFSALGVSV
jgi:hypothetical protein